MNIKQKADLMAWVHLMWILFGLISLPLLFIFERWGKIALSFACVTILSWIVFRGCWFVQLENKWRRQYNPAETFEEEGFERHYLKKLFNINYPRFSLRAITYAYLALLILISLVRIF